MNTGHRRPLLAGFLLVVSLAAVACDAPLERYEAQSASETEIVSVLMRYQEARNRFDLKRLLSLLHEDGRFTFQCGMMISKKRLKELLPGFWAELQAGDSRVIPIVHECINGDYYSSGRLNNPQIEIHDDRARATVLFTKGVCRVRLYVALQREDDRWLITRTEWGES
jgi:hypothetical protein